jgi:chromosome segregation ATPase
LEDRARGRYDALDRMSYELRRLQEQHDALDALVEALRTEDGWLAYRAEALRDQLLELEGRPAEGASAVEAVRTALVDRDEALRRARRDLAGAHAVAVEWEAEVVSARAQLQRDRAALEGARAWQSQAQERAKEAEELRDSLANKAAAVITAEEQLRQERVAREEAEGQLQQERAALAETRTVLERERLAREEALGRLQQERAALEGARAALKRRKDEASKLNGELVQLSISHEDLCQSLEEQEATVLDLWREAEEARKSLEVEKKQVEGELLSIRFPFC